MIMTLIVAGFSGTRVCALRNYSFHCTNWQLKVALIHIVHTVVLPKPCIKNSALLYG